MVWHFMGEWDPALLPMVVELYDIVDPGALIDRLLIIRDNL